MSATFPVLTKPTVTVKEILQHVRKIVLEEPRRLNLGMWCSMFKGHRISNYYPVPPEPECGTIGCIAGLGLMALDPKGASAGDINDRAADVMDQIFDRETDYLFSSGITKLDKLPSGNMPRSMGAPGTKGHAEKVARRITRFIRKNPKTLKLTVETGLHLDAYRRYRED